MRAVPLLLLLTACASGTDVPDQEPDARVIVDHPDASQPADAMPDDPPDATPTMPDAMVTTGGNPDTCAQAMNLTAAASAVGGTTVTGDNTGYANDAEPASTCTNGFGEDGPDAIYFVNATAGQTLSATVTPNAWDPAIYITQACVAVPTCVTGADAVAGTGAETVSTTIPTTGQYFVIVDSYIPGRDGTYMLHVTLQ